MVRKGKVPFTDSERSSVASQQGKGAFEPRDFVVQAKKAVPGEEVVRGELLDAYFERRAKLKAARGAGGLEVVQPKLKDKDIPKFKDAVAKQIPTLPTETVEGLIESESNWIQALKKAKTAAAKIERIAILKKDKSSSVSKASRSLAAELLSSYSPASHHYILLGNSPAVLRSALKEAKASFSDLPLGGLTNAKAQQEALGKSLKPDETRGAYREYLTQSKNLQTYLGSFLAKVKEPKLVVVDYTQSGGSAVVAADLLTDASKGEKKVSLFTFSKELPDDESLLSTQTDYDSVAAAPLGPDERTFVTLTDSKDYKGTMGLKAYQSLTLRMLEALDNANYEAVLKQFHDSTGTELIESL